jgi:AcrR family transcriptional regulator
VTGTHDVRRRLIDATVELLREGGLRGASPAAIADRAGASKMSLYRHFDGIDDLVATALGDYDQEQQRRLIGGPTDSTRSPGQRIVSMFESAAERADRPGFNGCLYVSTRLEVCDAEHPAAESARHHKQAMLEVLEAVLAEGGDPAPGQSAAFVLMLYDGALVHAVLQGSGAPLRQATAALAQLLPGVFAG